MKLLKDSIRTGAEHLNGLDFFQYASNKVINRIIGRTNNSIAVEIKWKVNWWIKNTLDGR